MRPDDQQAAEHDRDLLGTGYLYDGKRLDPARLTILTTPSAADAGAVEWVQMADELPPAGEFVMAASALTGNSLPLFVLADHDGDESLRERFTRWHRIAVPTTDALPGKKS